MCLRPVLLCKGNLNIFCKMNKSAVQLSLSFSSFYLYSMLTVYNRLGHYFTLINQGSMRNVSPYWSHTTAQVKSPLCSVLNWKLSLPHMWGINMCVHKCIHTVYILYWFTLANKKEGNAWRTKIRWNLGTLEICNNFRFHANRGVSRSTPLNKRQKWILKFLKDYGLKLWCINFE